MLCFLFVLRRGVVVLVYGKCECFVMLMYVYVHPVAVPNAAFCIN